MHVMWLELLAQVEELYVSHSSLLLFYLEKKMMVLKSEY